VKLLHSSFLLTIAAATCLTSQSSFADDKLTDSQVTQVKGVVHDYLVTNPQVLVEASQSLQKQEMAKMQQTAQNAIVQNANKLFADPATPIAGNTKGNVTVIEFFDYQCPHCKDMKPVVEKC
jgi:protein-disulfide isomerase